MPGSKTGELVAPGKPHLLSLVAIGLIGFAAPVPNGDFFVDVAKDSGIDFVHYNGPPKKNT